MVRTMNDTKNNFIPALRFNWLTRLYDPVVALTCREKTFKSLLVSQAAISPHQHVLDIGSGTGTLAILIKRRYSNTSVIGLDADRDIIEIANKKSYSKNISLKFVEGMSFDMPFGSNQFDLCVSSLFFHHLTTTDKEHSFREAYRVLKPGGEIHIADWGKPTGLLMRILFLAVQLIDGFKTTSDNVHGKLPDMIKKAGFVEVTIRKNISTPLGTIALYSAKKPRTNNANK